MMKNINDVIEETYNRVRLENPVITKKEVEEIVLYMFESFKNEMNSGKHTGVKIQHVGDFILSDSKILNYYNRIEHTLNNMTVKGERYNSILNRFNKMKPIFDKVVNHRKFINEKRKEYLKNKYGNG